MTEESKDDTNLEKIVGKKAIGFVENPVAAYVVFENDLILQMSKRNARYNLIPKSEFEFLAKSRPEDKMFKEILDIYDSQ